MKKVLIIYAVIFALTIAVPALVCFANADSAGSDELVSIFRSCVTVIECCR